MLHFNITANIQGIKISFLNYIYVERGILIGSMVYAKLDEPNVTAGDYFLKYD